MLFQMPFSSVIHMDIS